MANTPVVFIHGLWLHATSWQPWIELFTERGYAPSAPGWPGDPDTVQQARENPRTLANRGIDEVTEHYAKIIDGLPAKPVLIGHSFGGMIVQKLLGLDYGAAGVAIGPAQIKGVLRLPPSTLRATLPVFKNPANMRRALSLTADQFHYAFGNAIPRAESEQLYDKWTIPAPGRPVFEAAAANVFPHSPLKVRTDNAERGPLLLITGGQDHTVPAAVTQATLKRYKHSSAVTDLMEFADRGHSLTIDSGWREVAEACLTWLGKHGL